MGSLEWPGIKASNASFLSYDLADLTNAKDFAYVRSGLEIVQVAQSGRSKLFPFLEAPLRSKFKVSLSLRVK